MWKEIKTREKEFSIRNEEEEKRTKQRKKFWNNQVIIILITNHIDLAARATAEHNHQRRK